MRCNLPRCTHCDEEIVERRERPRLERASVFFWLGVPHYYRGTCPSFVANGPGDDEWIEVLL